MNRLLHIFMCVAVAAGAMGLATYPRRLAAQEPDAKRGNHSLTVEPLATQLRELQAKVAKLEAALKQNHQATTSSDDEHASHHGAKTMTNMSGMQHGSMKGMGGMGKGMGMMSGMGSMSGMNMGAMDMMSGQGMAGMDMSGMGGMSMMGQGMGMMGQMKGMGQMQMASALPGFPGASHIYHIGSTNFFLDHPQHITLSQEQLTKLNQIKEKTLLGQGSLDRWTAEAEQELWVLTSSDAPKATEIEAKIREIEKLRGDKRIAFIRAVGEAAKVLSDDQRKTLIGTLPPDHASGHDSNQH